MQRLSKLLTEIRFTFQTLLRRAFKCVRETMVKNLIIVAMGSTKE